MGCINIKHRPTLDAEDIIDGGAGEDTLNVVLNSNFTGLTGDGKITNVENIVLNNNTTSEKIFDATGITGATKYVIDGTNAIVNIKDMSTKADIELSNIASGEFSATLDTDAAEIDGTSDSINLSLTNIGTIDNPDTDTTDEREAVSISLENIEDVKATTNGNSVVQFGKDLKTLAVDGEGYSDLSFEVDSGLSSVDTSAMVGDAKIDVTNASGISSVISGAGDDTIKIKADASVANATVTGGEGADTLNPYSQVQMQLFSIR